MGEAAQTAAPAETSEILGRAESIAARFSRQIRVFRCWLQALFTPPN